MPDRKIGRQFVGNRAQRIFTATRPCLLNLWAAPTRSGGQEGSLVYWELEMDKCSLNEGIPLTTSRIVVPVALEPGESIFAICEDQALVGWSVTEAFEDFEEGE